MWNPLAILLVIIRIFLLLFFMAIYLLSYGFAHIIGFRHTTDRAFKLRKSYLGLACIILGIKTEIQGQLNTSGHLVVSNHRSLSDPLVLLRFVNAFVIAKAEVSNIPIVDTGARVTGILYVQREEKDSRTAVREKMVEILENKQNVLVYPEGTVNYDKKVMTYRPGTFKEVAAKGLSVVPVVLEYRDAKDIWANSSMMKHFFKKFGSWRTHCKVIIGEPMTAEEGTELRDKVENWTNQKIEEIHTNWNSIYNKYDTIPK